MPRYRVTLAFDNISVGATETYYSPVTELSALGPMVQVLLDKRLELMEVAVEVVGVRIADADKPRRSAFYPPGTYTLAMHGIDLVVPPTGTATVADPKTIPDQPRACMQMRVGFGDGYSSIRYLAFVPDALLTGGKNSLAFNAATDFNTDFPLFVAELKTRPWSLKVRDRNPIYGPKPIVKWVGSSDAPSDVGVEIENADMPELVAKDYVHITGVRRTGTDQMSYNGKYKVSEINDTLIPNSRVIYLWQTSQAEVSTVKLPGSLMTHRMTYEAIKSVMPLRAGVHKRGKPLGLLRGRVLRRARLDP